MENGVKYFNLFEYVENITLKDYLLRHLDETNNNFDKYMYRLFNYSEEYIIDYWIKSLYQELESSQNIENQKFYKEALVGTNLCFDSLTISHKRIFSLHNFILQDENKKTHAYRKTPVRVSTIRDGKELIFWWGVDATDIQKFMNDFIEIYKLNRTSLLYSNPFLSSALMHLLFDRIHPFTDGNGRTARIIQNLKFTEGINKYTGAKLKLSPLNLSSSILRNKITYAKRMNNIKFNLEENTNNEINEWLNFSLDMADEQIYYLTNELERKSAYIEKAKTPSIKKLSKISKRYI